MLERASQRLSRDEIEETIMNQYERTMKERSAAGAKTLVVARGGARKRVNIVRSTDIP